MVYEWRKNDGKSDERIVIEKHRYLSYTWRTRRSVKMYVFSSSHISRLGLGRICTRKFHDLM